MRIVSVLSVSALASVFALAAACGGTPPQPPLTPEPPVLESDAGADTTDGAAPETDAAPAADTAPAAKAEPLGPKFDSMTKEEKAAHMKKVVVPAMTKVFQELDAKKFATVTCKTCHGAKMAAPQKVLPKLKLSGDGFEKLSQKNAKVVKFMSERVGPEMAKALGEEPYDPATKKGFGCGGCHSVE